MPINITIRSIDVCLAIVSIYDTVSYAISEILSDFFF